LFIFYIDSVEHTMALRVHVDETACGALCQHPACWHSNTRQDKGFPRLRPRPPSPPDLELGEKYI